MNCKREERVVKIVSRNRDEVSEVGFQRLESEMRTKLERQRRMDLVVALVTRRVRIRMQSCWLAGCHVYLHVVCG
jgi:chromosome condensin MukBEF MukE localization factor